MKDSSLILPVSGPAELAYVELPDGSRSGQNQNKMTLILVSGLFIMVSLVGALVLIGNDMNGHMSLSDTSRETVRPAKVVTRGPEAGVSEKSNVKLLSVGEGTGYPWNNSMLSWQHSAFHFQPEKNWMNGTLLFVIDLFLF